MILGEIKSGAEAKRTLWIKHDGDLKVRATIAGAVYEKTIADYVTNNDGGKFA